MKIIGLTGSIAVGKSTVANIFKQHEIPVFDSDLTVHSLYEKNGEGVLVISELAPKAIKNEKVDRKLLSQYIISDNTLLSKIENKIHPLVQNEKIKFLENAKKNHCPYVILDIPLLFETEQTNKVDYIILIVSSPEIQKNRVLSREGMTVEKYETLLRRQIPTDYKISHSDYVIENTGSLVQLKNQIEWIIQKFNKGDFDA